MFTARQIAERYVSDELKVADLERAILRHMEHYMMRAVEVEREACAVLTETFFDDKTDNISCHQANGADKIAKAIRNQKT